MPSTHPTSSSTLADFKKQFGQRLATIRRDKKMTQEELARKMKVDPVYIAYLEGAKRSPSFETVYKLSVVLEVRSAELFE